MASFFSSTTPVIPVIPVVPVARRCSGVATEQGPDGTCYAHAMSKTIGRFLKFHFPRDFKNQPERASWLYDTIKCREQQTIFPFSF